MAGYATLHAPFLLEDEIARLKDQPSTVINNRIQSSLSELIVKQSCSYMLSGIPYIAVGNGNQTLATDFGNRVFSRTIPRDKFNKVIPHAWFNAAYRAFYSELLIENNYQLPKDKQLAAYLTAIPAIYVVVSGNRIVDYSSALKYQLEVWKSENQKTSWTTEDFFGTPLVTGNDIDYTSPASYNYYGITLSGSGTNYGGSITGYVPAGVTRISLFANSSSLEQPLIALDKTSRFVNIRKEGGSTTTTSSSVGGSTPPVVTSKTLDGPLVGTGKPKWTVVVTFPENITRVAPIDDRGYWSCEYPRPYTSLELQEISVTQQESPELGLTQTQITEATVQRSYGLPILDFVSGDPYSASVVNLAQAASLSSNYNLKYLRIVFKPTSPKYAVTSLYVGSIYNDGAVNKTFLSYPGSIVQEMGVELRLDTYIEPLDTVSPTVLVSPDSSPSIVSITAGVENTTTYLKNISTYWESEQLTLVTDRLKFIYEASYDPIVEYLKIRWDENEEVREVIDRLRYRWESESVAWDKEELAIWYEVELPEDRTVRNYATFFWDKEVSQEYNNVITLPYLKERSYYTTNTLEIRWDETLVDPIILQPYFVQLYDPKTFTYTDCISFNVWGDEKLVSQYILNDELRFLFSNPIKYELVMFDYNLNPYSEVFLSRIDDFNMDLKNASIPDKYTKIGNYTIKDINRFNSFSLDIIAGKEQLNEYRSYWIPEILEDYKGSFITLTDKKSKALLLDNIFREDHHEDSVELDLVILDTNECCFTQSSVGSRCSPY